MYHSSSSCSCFSDDHDQLPDHRFASHASGNFELRPDGLGSPVDSSHGRGKYGLRRDGLRSPLNDCPYSHPSPLRGGSYIDAHVVSADFDACNHGFPKVNSDIVSADFDAPSVAHPESANLDAPRSGISY